MPCNYRIKDLFAHYDVDENGCWIWRGAVNGEGYGSNRRGGKTVRMHREYYKHFNGEIPDGLQVCHECDVPRCVNPNHLFIGTNLENAHDRDRKGRTILPPRGELHNKAKLTRAQVVEARRLWKCGQSIRGLARMYGLHHKSMSKALKGESWSNVPHGDSNEQ
jgi:hypothetical protein